MSESFFFLVLPIVFFAGLLLIPIGVYLSKRDVVRGLAETTFDRKAALRRLGLFLGLTTLVNVVLGTQLTYRAVKHMETQQFCGSTCHSMKPEFPGLSECAAFQIKCVSARRAWCGGMDPQQDKWGSATGQDRPQDSNDADTFCFGKQPPRALSRDL